MTKRQILGALIASVLAPLLAFCGYLLIKPETATSMLMIVGVSITLAILGAQLAIAWYKTKSKMQQVVTID